MAYQGNGDFNRQMYQGNWTCSGCGTAITELPFEPSPDRLDTLLCRDCHASKRGSRGGGSGGRFGGGQRRMVQGNWTCSGCGTAITELPFEPSPDRLDTLLCRDCHGQKSGFRSKGMGGERRMVQGNWKCAKCGTAITELPFEPSPGREGDLMCRDCYKSGRG